MNFLFVYFRKRTCLASPELLADLVLVDEVMSADNLRKMEKQYH